MRACVRACVCVCVCVPQIAESVCTKGANRMAITPPALNAAEVRL